MGGSFDFRPSRVYHTAKLLLSTGRIKEVPPWFVAVANNPPPHILTRTQPVQHSGYGRQRPTRKLKKQFMPQAIRYPEDKMRNTFFADHPWELARPRILLEGNKADGGEDWGSVRPKGLKLQPENVVRRQLWLIEHENYDPQTAYNTARREFYRERLREDIERKVAKEEAMHMGAYFDKSTIAWGMELEDRKFHGFKEWASRRMLLQENARQSMMMGIDVATLNGGSAVEDALADTEADGEGEDKAAGDSNKEKAMFPPRAARLRQRRQQSFPMDDPDSDSRPPANPDGTGASLRM